MSSGYSIHKNDSFYFVTFTVIHWIDVFTRDLYRELFLESVKHCQKHKKLEVGAWVIMTNHVHMIIASGDPEEFPLSGIIRDLKSYTSRHIRKEIEGSTTESRKNWMLPLFYKKGSKNLNNKDFQLWIQDNHPIELSDQTRLSQRLNYLHQNPVQADFVSRAEDCVWSSASAYSGELSPIEITFLD